MFPDLTIINIMDSNSNTLMILHGEWTDSNVRLLLNDGSTSWNGQVDKYSATDTTLSQLDLNPEEYFERLKSALGDSNGSTNFKYSLEGNTLRWAKVVTPDFTQLHEPIILTPVQSSSQAKLINSLLTSCSSLLHQLTDSQAHYKALKEEHLHLNETFASCCKTKIDLENTLYAKFALVLNEKKEYVRRVTGLNSDEKIFGPAPVSRRASEASTCKTMSLRQFSKRIKLKDDESSDSQREKEKIEPHIGASTSCMDY